MKLINLKHRLLLHPEIPPDLHGLNPRTILGNRWWAATRKKSYAQNNHKCWACDVNKKQARYHKWLEGHECYIFDYAINVATYQGTVALCHSCHSYIHSGRLFHLYTTNKISKRRYNTIIKHGNNVLNHDYKHPNFQHEILESPFTKNLGHFHKTRWSLQVHGKFYRRKT